MPMSGKEQAVLNYLAKLDQYIGPMKNPQIVVELTDNDLEDLYKMLKRHVQEMEYWASQFKFYKNEQTRRVQAGLPESLEDIALGLADLLDGKK